MHLEHPHRLQAAVRVLQSGDSELLRRLLADVLPSCSCRVLSLAALGGGPLGVRAVQELDLELLAVCEPWGAPIPDCSPLQGANLSLYPNLSDMRATSLAHEFCVVLAPQLLLCAEAAGPSRDLPSLVHHLLDVVLAPGGAAVLGAPAPRGRLHAFLSALDPGGYYLTSDAVRALAEAHRPDVQLAAEVEHTEELRFETGEEVGDVLRLCARQVRPPDEGAAEALAARAEAAAPAAVAAAKGGAEGFFLPVEMVYLVLKKAATRPQVLSTHKTAYSTGDPPPGRL